MVAKSNPPVIDTTKLTGAEPDPRGDYRPGVIPDQPKADGINPITNTPEEFMNEDGVTAGDQHGAIYNAPEGQKSKPAEAKAPTGRKVEMIADRDYWPRTKPDGYGPDDEYRVRAGETFSVPQSEAEDLMEAGTAKRANRRA